MRALEDAKRDGKIRHIGLAGDMCKCAQVAAQFPGLAQVVQVDAASGVESATSAASFDLPIHFSFGHFREKQAPMRRLLADAVERYPNGVLLYSSRRASRVSEIARTLTDVEGS